MCLPRSNCPVRVTDVFCLSHHSTEAPHHPTPTPAPALGYRKQPSMEPSIHRALLPSGFWLRSIHGGVLTEGEKGQDTCLFPLSLPPTLPSSIPALFSEIAPKIMALKGIPSPLLRPHSHWVPVLLAHSGTPHSPL